MKLIDTYLITLLSTAGATAAPSAIAQNLIVNGSFETPVIGIAEVRQFAPNELEPWQTTDANFELWSDGFINTTNPPQYSAHGRQNLEILSNASSVTIAQTIQTTPGQSYRLAFYHTPRIGVDSVFTARVNTDVVATFNENGTLITNFQWQFFKTNFTASTSFTTISFSDQSACCNGGTHLDGVSVELLPRTINIRISQVDLFWDSITNETYQVQYRSSLTTNIWTNLGSSVQGNGSVLHVIEDIPFGEPQRFYRLLTVP